MDAVRLRRVVLLGLTIPAALFLGCEHFPTRSRTTQTPPPPAPPVVRPASAEAPTVPAQPPPETATPLPIVPAPTLTAPPPTTPGTVTGPALNPPADAATDPAAAMRRLLRRAIERSATMDSYIARLQRKEQVNGKDQPLEVLSFKYRKLPLSIHMKWIGAEGHGRELAYVQGQHDNKLNVLTAKGDIPLMPAGRVMHFDPDSPLVRSNSRHSITEAGFDYSLRRMTAALDAHEQHRPGSGALTYLGRVKRPEFAQPAEGVEQTIPPGHDPQLPNGGRRHIFFDPVLELPVLAVTYDAQQHEVEYYFFDRFQFPVALDDQDFDPARLWPTARK
jgi:hypothetical protein